LRPSFGIAITILDGWRHAAKTMGVDEVLTAPPFRWQNACAKRLIGSMGRECLDHVIIYSETGLRRVLSGYVEYYELSRAHLSLEKAEAGGLHRRKAVPNSQMLSRLGMHYERRADSLSCWKH
jgi:hypothetical protein